MPDGYILDVALDNSFTDMVSGYPVTLDNVLFYDVTGLTYNTTYYYRVREYNNGIEGYNSNIIEITLPLDWFIEYTKAFSEIASTGKSAAVPLLPLSEIVDNVDISTFLSYEECILYRDKLVKDLVSVYNRVLGDASAIITMRPSFDGLSNLLYSRTKLTPDNYLTEEGLKVDATYAAIQMNISETNIE